MVGDMFVLTLQDLSQLSSPSNSSFSQNDFLNEVEDFDPEELESFLNKSDLGSSLTNLELEEEISEIERALNLPKTLPTDEYFRDVLSPQSLGKGPSTCPADAVRVKKLQGLNLTEDEIRLIIKDRQKKDNHNMSKNSLTSLFRHLVVPVLSLFWSFKLSGDVDSTSTTGSRSWARFCRKLRMGKPDRGSCSS